MPRDEAKLRNDVLSMRERLLQGHPNESGLFDLKHDRGGMIDIEFIVQMLVLAHAHRRPELTANAGNIALLKLAAKLGLISGDSGDAVADAYREYRRRQHRLRLSGAKYARVLAAEVQCHIDATQALWRRGFGREGLFPPPRIVKKPPGIARPSPLRCIADCGGFCPGRCRPAFPRRGGA